MAGRAIFEYFDACGEARKKDRYHENLSSSFGLKMLKLTTTINLPYKNQKRRIQ
jgi:hypothetical protein